MKTSNRRRTEIICLNTGERFINESFAEKILDISRYYIRKSLKEHVPVKGDKMFAHYYYGMNIEEVKNIYMQNYTNQIIRSNKWKTMVNSMKKADL
jgi:hypothetical protein